MLRSCHLNHSVMDDVLSSSFSARYRWDNPDSETVQKIRERAKLFARTGRYAAAEFWMDKIVAFSNYQNLSDVFDMCEYLFLDGQYIACRTIIESKGAHKDALEFRYLLGRCLFSTGEIEEALKVLNETVKVRTTNRKASNRETYLTETDIDDATDIHMSNVDGSPDELSLENSYLSAIHLLRGKIYDKLDNRQLALSSYLDALEADPFSYDALDYLTSRQALTKYQRHHLAEDVVPKTRSSSDEPSLAEALYLCKLEPDYDLSGEDKLEWRKWNMTRFAMNPDFLLTRAEFLLSRRDYASCLEVTSKIMKQKPYHRSSLSLHVAALVHLGESAVLFELSHRLANLYPQSVYTWYATAAYYYVCGSPEMTRRYLAKAVSFDKSCGFVWLLYGHSFSREREHEQALAAYFHAVDIMKGSSFPYLYIAREYVRTNNFVLAEKFYEEARVLAPADPVVLHEIGVLQMKKADSLKDNTAEDHGRKELQAAVTNFKKAFDLVRAESNEQRVVDTLVESILESLAAAYMKLRDGHESLQYATSAFYLNSKNTSVMKLMGLSYIMLGKLGNAVDIFQRALALNKNDDFVKKVLLETVKLYADEGLSSALAPIDLNVMKKPVRIVKGPETRLSAKRNLAKKSALALAKSTPVTLGSVHDASMNMSLTSESDREPSFVGEFLPPSNATQLSGGFGMESMTLDDF